MICHSLEKCSASTSCCLHAMHATALAQLKETKCQRAALAVALGPYEEKKPSANDSSKTI